MMKHTIAAAALLFAAPAFAQSTMSPANPANERAPTVTNPGSPAAVNSGPGSTGTVSTEATGAGNISSNPAAAGNAGQPNQAADSPGSQK